MIREFLSLLIRGATSRYVVYIASLVNNIILSRILTPDDFGLMVSVLLIYGFMQQVTESGITPIIISRRDLSPEDAGGIFKATALLGFMNSIIIVAAVAALSQARVLSWSTNLVALVSTAAIISCMTTVPQSIIQKRQKFFIFAIAGFLSELIGGLVSLVLYRFHLLYGADILGIKLLTSVVVSFIVGVYWLRRSGEIVFSGDISASLKLRQQGKFQVLFNIMIYITRNADNFVIAQFFGARQLGVYDKAYQLMRYPITLLSYAIGPTLLGALVSKNLSSREVSRLIEKLAIISLLMSIPLSVVIFILSPIAIPAIFGENWERSSSILRILTLSLPLQIISATSGSVYQAMNRNDLLLLSGVLNCFCMAGALAIGVMFGKVEAIAWATSVSFIVGYFINYYILYNKCLKCSSARFLWSTGVPTVSMAVVLGIFIWCEA